jgi:hypothetical protein
MGSWANGQMDWWTDGQRDRWADRKTDRGKDGLSDIRTNRHCVLLQCTAGLMDSWTDRQMGCGICKLSYVWTNIFMKKSKLNIYVVEQINK